MIVLNRKLTLKESETFPKVGLRAFGSVGGLEQVVRLLLSRLHLCMYLIPSVVINPSLLSAFKCISQYKCIKMY